MSGTVREDLLGYLLNALDEHEQEQVSRAVAADERLQHEVSCLRRHLAILSVDREHHEPPEGLAVRTCGCLDSAWEDEAADASSDILEPPANWRRVGSGDLALGLPATSQPSPSVQSLHPLSPLREFVSLDSWSRADIIVLSGIVLVASFLFFPALAHSLYRSRELMCQNNLRQLAVALSQYSEGSNQYFPSLDVRGPRAFAGAYYPTLYQSGLVRSPDVVHCPGVHRPLGAGWRNITLEELDRAEGKVLDELQRQAGGDYAYHLGFIRNGVYHSPRNRHRTHFAVLGDAPGGKRAGIQSDNHEGRGQNVLFEDGHYEYLDRAIDLENRDHLYTNRLGWIAPGSDEDDAVLAASETPVLTVAP